MDYTPVVPKPPEQKPEYVLVNDVSGNPPLERGPKTLVDSKGNQFTVPYPPKANCKKCYGRGYIGTDSNKNEIILCRKCYPFNKK